MYSIEYLTNARLKEFYPAYCKYKQKIHDSKVRGLQVNISFADWYLWWLFNGINKKLSTKHCSSQPCMCRKNDVGDYNLDNIYLDTRGNNTRLSNNLRWSGKCQKRIIPKFDKIRTLSRTGFRFGQVLVTPMGKFINAEEAATAHNLAVGTIHNTMRLKLKSDWYWENKNV